MKHLTIRNLLLFMLCILFLAMSGCADTPDDAALLLSPSPVPEPPGAGHDLVLSTIRKADQVITLNYHPDASLNPVNGTDTYNMIVASLLYEGLFTLDDSLQPQPVLCESCETTDGITYTIQIRSDAVFHDGTPVTAYDAEYTLSMAMYSEKYQHRLQDIAEITAVSSTELVIVLQRANYQLPTLLDIPIIQTGTMESDQPIGSGPYYLTDDKTKLQAFSSYYDYENLDQPYIYLKEVAEDMLTEAFSVQEIDLLFVDPTGITKYNIQANYEARNYNASILHYIGFNTEHDVLSNPEIRRAISHAIDRDYIAHTLFGARAVAAPILLHPASANYDPAMAEGAAYDLAKLSTIFLDQGMGNGDNDVYLEYFVDDMMYDFSIDFIVNAENSYKVNAAQEITSSLKNVGVDVQLQILPWEEYQEALEEGDYDMYYAEVMLSPDCDPLEILSPDGSLNFGGVQDETYEALYYAYLGADADRHAEAAAAFCDYLYQQSDIIPIVYKKLSVYTHRNVFEGMTPSQSGILNGISSYHITLK